MKTYIEIKPYLPFYLEYLYIDDKDMSIMVELLNYYKVPYRFDNLVVNNKIFDNFIVRDIQTLPKYREDIEGIFDIMRNKLRFKYKDFDDYYEMTKKLLEAADNVSD